MGDNESIVILKKALKTLSLKLPLTTDLEFLMKRDFSLISQREAYETLRYLLNACGQVAKLNENSFTDVRWKSADPEIKRRIEKCKRYVFDSIEILSKENKVPINKNPKLKKSDLLVPHSIVFFNTCLSLVNYALSHQLGNCGFYFWPRIEGYESIRMFYSNVKEDEGHEFEIQQETLVNDIKLLEDAIKKLQVKKSEIHSLLDNEISKCPYSCALKEESERSKILESWKHETDELHKINLEKIKKLEDLNGQLALLGRLMVKKEKFIINGEELRKSIHPEVQNLAEMNGLPLIRENQLDIPALFKIFHLSLPKTIKNKEMVRQLLLLKLPVIDTGLLSKLEIRKKKLEERCEDFHRHFGEDDKAKASEWLKNFLFYIPKVEFNELNTSVSTREPIVDEDKLLSLAEFSEKSSRCEKNNIPLASRKGKDMFHRFRDFNSKYCQKKDNQMAAKRDSKKPLGRICKGKRRSSSLINLPALSTSIKSSDKLDSPCGSEASRKLCSTPKENHNSSFVCDRSISPISILSAKDKSYLSQPRIPVMGDANESTLNDSDVHASLLNSYMSTDFDHESENKLDTFDFTNSPINITLDSSPSGISMNLSTVSNFISK